MLASERNFLYFDLKVDVKKAHDRIPSMMEIAKAWESCLGKNYFLYSRANGDLTFRARDLDIKESDGVVVFLVESSNLNAPDSASSNIKTGDLRVHAKKEDEGGALAAHLVISLTENKKVPNTYLMFIEEVRGLPHRFIALFLNSLLRKLLKQDSKMFPYKDQTGARDSNGEIITRFSKPSILLKGHISNEILSEIDAGEISLVMLEDAKAKEGVGDDRSFEYKNSVIKIAVKDDFPKNGKLMNLTKRLKSYIGFEINKTSNARVVFVDDSDTQKSVKFDPRSGELVDLHYIKRARVTNLDLATSATKIVESLSSKMIEEMKIEKKKVE